MKRPLTLLTLLALPAWSEPLALAWDANSPTEYVEGYRVYRVAEEGQELLVQTEATTALIDVLPEDKIYLAAYRRDEEAAGPVYIVRAIPTESPLTPPVGVKITGNINFELVIEPLETTEPTPEP